MEKGKFKECQSSSFQTEPNTVVRSYSAQEVADAFVKQYYKVMESIPSEGHKFYKEESIRSHPTADGSMKSTTTLEGIDDEIMASNIKEWNPDLSTVNAQDSVMGSVIVAVLGSLTDNADMTRNFVQTFFLYPQEGGGFYVHNDILRFIEIIKSSEASSRLDDVANALSDGMANSLADDVPNPQTALQANVTRGEEEDSVDSAHATNKSTSEKEDGDNKNEVAESSEGKNPLPTKPKAKIQPSVWKSPPSKQEETKKLSYASILAKKGSRPGVFSASPKPSAFPVISSGIRNNLPLENIYDVKAIRVKDLPPKLTREALHEVVKQFGPVKQKNIQIKEYSEDGYRYAFVEFDDAKSARTAIEARVIRFNDQVSEIQYKKLPDRGGHNYMGQPPYGRGGYLDDNVWGHGGGGRNGGSGGRKDNARENFAPTRDYNSRRNG